ncbi:tyrosine-type recombinase/integrase [Enterococcus faecalis]|uniref:tyrosine-type recombinase/integrase n=1 Tax=Enterococcus faecalis TaxID=1351 RepID=UPI0029876F74|nr:tyrosine-type recombinase/integrase [Enterococcus faecalis]EKB7628479.1 tyrosine-type recombinase/integrase [Enterococcus faecalis]
MPRIGDNIYKRKDGRWEGRYPIGRKESGQLRYGYIYGRTLSEVRDRLLPLRKKLAQRTHFQQVGCMNYHTWSQQWLTSIQTTVKPATYASYSYKLKRYIFPSFGTLSLYQITQEKVQDLQRTWQGTGLAVSSIKILLSLLGETFKVAEKAGLIEKNPCVDVETPKPVKKNIRALSLMEQKVLEKAAKIDGHGNALAVLMAMHTGMRIGEICALKWRDIRFDQQLLTVEATYQLLVYVP